jgi:hypothetical protein
VRLTRATCTCAQSPGRAALKNKRATRQEGVS